MVKHEDWESLPQVYSDSENRVDSALLLKDSEGRVDSALLLRDSENRIDSVLLLRDSESRVDSAPPAETQLKRVKLSQLFKNSWGRSVQPKARCVP